MNNVNCSCLKIYDIESDENRCVVRDSLNEIKIYAKNKEIYDGDIFLWVSSRYTLDSISGPQKVLSETTLETNFALKSS